MFKREIKSTFKQHKENPEKFLKNFHDTQANDKKYPLDMVFSFNYRTNSKKQKLSRNIDLHEDVTNNAAESLNNLIKIIFQRQPQDLITSIKLFCQLLSSSYIKFIKAPNEHSTKRTIRSKIILNHKRTPIKSSNRVK